MKNILEEEISYMKKLFDIKGGFVISEAVTERQTHINNTFCSVKGGVIVNPNSSVNNGKKWDDYVSENTVTANEIEVSKKTCPNAELSKTANNQTPAPKIPEKLKNAEGVMKFQEWLDTNKAGWATGYPGNILKQGKGYGRFGPRTSRAWGLYKTEFLTPTAEVKPITQEEIKVINDVKTTSSAPAATAGTNPQITIPSNVVAANAQASANRQAGEKKYEDYYKKLVDSKLIDPVGGDRIVYKGEPPSQEVEDAINIYLTSQGYTKTKEKTKNDGRVKLVYVK
jgi:hypothetical protein